jgi:hypothetical protein
VVPGFLQQADEMCANIASVTGNKDLHTLLPLLLLADSRSGGSRRAVAR